MQQPLQISFRYMVPSEAVTSVIRKKFEKLERFFSKITSCHVVVEVSRQHHQHGKIYQVNVDLRLPGALIIAKSNANIDPPYEDIYAAIHDAFDAVGYQLEDYMRRHYIRNKAYQKCNEELRAQDSVHGS